jgi:folate-binding protein YgfZ
MSRIVIPLEDWALIHVIGPDAETYLQGQLTNDVTVLSGGRIHLTGFCTPKGRIRSLFVGIGTGEEYFLALPADRLEESVRALSMFILNSRVTIQPSADPIWMILDKVCSVGESTADGSTVAAQLTDGIAFRIGGSVPEGETGSLESRDQALVNAGIPVITQATSEMFTPQMINLDRCDGVSFTKGCYVGQEVVARTHYLGEPKRRAMIFDVDATLSPGNALLTGDGETSGTVVYGAPGRCLAVVPVDVPEGLETENGIPLTLRDLPYALTDGN